MIEKGIEKGVEQGMHNVLLLQLARKFKKIPGEYREKIKKLDPATLNALAVNIFEIKNLKELENYFS
jgi:hypothetical protein